jgi:SAM-dependent methyltransferase
VEGRPSAWLVDNLDILPRGRPVLDLACGHGRHALWLAERGWPVHAVDRDETRVSALAAAAQARQLPITTEQIDLEASGVTLGLDTYGAVVVVHYLHRGLFPAIVAALAPGGVLVYETFTKGQASRGRPRNPAFLLDEGELLRLVSPLTVLRWREGDVDGRLVASVVARRSQAEPTLRTSGAAT